MTGQPNWRTNIDAADWIGSVEKRILHTERRPSITTASELMGPGMAPYAVELLDWDADETAFNGFFWSQPGAINSPDPGNNKWFMGGSEATVDGFGLQWAAEFNDIAGDAWPSPAHRWERRFFDPGLSGTRTFSRWALTSDPRYIGEAIMTGSETPPNDRYLFANGQAVDRDDYAALFACFGILHGAGDLTTTFNIPDMRSRFPRASDALNGRPVGGHDSLLPADRTTQHTHPIPEEVMADSQNTTVGGTAGRLQGSPNNITHDHTGTTGQSANDYFPRMNWAFHIRALP